MFGNKYSGDLIAEEFYKTLALKKIAMDGEDLGALPSTGETKGLDFETDSTPENPEDFLLKEFGDDFDPNVDSRIENLDALDSSISGDSGELSPENTSEPLEEGLDQSFEDENLNYLIDRQALKVLNGLGKIAGNLKRKKENFAADVVESTAMKIQLQAMQEAKAKLETIKILKKIASDISNKGDNFTADVVEATILKIKNN